MFGLRRAAGILPLAGSAHRLFASHNSGHHSSPKTIDEISKIVDGLLNETPQDPPKESDTPKPDRNKFYRQKRYPMGETPRGEHPCVQGDPTMDREPGTKRC